MNHTQHYLYHQPYIVKTEWAYCKDYCLLTRSSHSDLLNSSLAQYNNISHDAQLDVFPMWKRMDHPLRKHLTKHMFQSTFPKWGQMGGRDMCKCKGVNWFALTFKIMNGINLKVKYEMTGKRLFLFFLNKWISSCSDWCARMIMGWTQWCVFHNVVVNKNCLVEKKQDKLLSSADVFTLAIFFWNNMNTNSSIIAESVHTSWKTTWNMD